MARRYQYQATTFVVPPASAPVAPPPIGWFMPFSQPAPAPVATNMAGESWAPFNPIPPVPTPTQYGWYAPLSQPVLPPARTPDSYFTFVHFVPITATPTQMGWYQQWANPVHAAQAPTMGGGNWVPSPPPPAPPANVQNYVDVGTHNYISQEIGTGVEF